MSIRDKLEKNKKWVVPASLVLAAVAVVLAAKNMSADRVSDKMIDRAYFTVDEGKTYFEDDLSKSYPFDHEGKKAFRAYVFKCGDGKPFVGMLGRLVAAKPAAAGPQKYDQPSGGPAIEMKKPGTDAWYPSNSAETYKIIGSLCPDGRPTAVIPGQVD